MTTIPSLKPYTESLSHTTHPQMTAIKEFPEWFVAGINPQEFLIPMPQEQILLQLTNRAKFPNFYRFLADATNSSVRAKIDSDSEVIEASEEVQKNFHIKTFIQKKDGSLRSKYVRDYALVQRIEMLVLQFPVAMQFNEIHELKQNFVNIEKWNTEYRHLAEKVEAKQANPIAVAAWTMREIIRAEPFTKQNRKIARIFASAFLQLGGYRAIFFPDKKKLNVAIRADLAEPGHLAGFLEKTIKWNQKQEGLNK